MSIEEKIQLCVDDWTHSTFREVDPASIFEQGIRAGLEIAELANARSAEYVNVIFDYWRKRMDSPRSKLDAKRKKVITAALKIGYTPAEICQAIRGCSLTPHNMGQNENGQKYNGIELILRNADQIDRFIANDKAPPALNKPQPRDMRAERNAARKAAFNGFDSTAYQPALKPVPDQALLGIDEKDVW